MGINIIQDNHRNDFNNDMTCDSLYPYCIEGKCGKVSPYPWQNKGLSHYQLETYMAWVPIAGSAVGNIIGGLVCDKIAVSWGSHIRALFAGIGCILSLPLVVMAINSEYPSCFYFMIFSGLVGESYMGQAIALFIESSPEKVVVSSVALFLFFANTIGGGAPLLVPALIGYKNRYTAPTHVSFYASSSQQGNVNDVFWGNAKNSTSLEYFYVVLSSGGGLSLKWSLVTSFGMLYGLSGILYILCFYLYSYKKDKPEERI